MHLSDNKPQKFRSWNMTRIQNMRVKQQPTDPKQSIHARDSEKNMIILASFIWAVLKSINWDY